MSIFPTEEKVFQETHESSEASQRPNTQPPNLTKELHGRKPLTFRDWQRVRRTNPNLYYTPRTQKLMVTDATALAGRFFDNPQKGRSK